MTNNAYTCIFVNMKSVVKAIVYFTALPFAVIIAFAFLFWVLGGGYADNCKENKCQLKRK